MTGNGVGYASKRKEKRMARGEVSRMSKVYDSIEESTPKQGERSDYRRCLVTTVIDPEMIRVGLPKYFIEDEEGIMPVYPNPVKGRDGTYVLEKPIQSVGVNGLGDGGRSNTTLTSDNGSGKRSKPTLW